MHLDSLKGFDLRSPAEADTRNGSTPRGINGVGRGSVALVEDSGRCFPGPVVRCDCAEKLFMDLKSA
jgi:hypothetical protein